MERPITPPEYSCDPMPGRSDALWACLPPYHLMKPQFTFCLCKQPPMGSHEGGEKTQTVLSVLKLRAGACLDLLRTCLPTVPQRRLHATSRAAALSGGGGAHVPAYGGTCPAPGRDLIPYLVAVLCC